MKPKTPLYVWRVRCIDRTTKTLFDRDLVFAPGAHVADDDVRTARCSLESHSREKMAPSLRHLFRETTQPETREAIRESRNFRMFSLVDYFEDEHGQGLDGVELIAILSGTTVPIVMGDPRSILRLPLSGMRSISDWTLQKSNDIAHFVQSLRIIQLSTWWRESASLETGGELRDTYRLTLPPLDSTAGALALIRQLITPRDDVFRCAARHYIEHVEDQRKRIWVQNEIDAFEKLLDSPPMFGPPGFPQEISTQQLLELVVYGTGLFH